MPMRFILTPPQLAPWAHCPYRCRPPVALAGSAQFSWFLAFPRTVARFPFPHVHILHVLHDVVQPLSQWATILGFPPIAPNRPTIFFTILSSHIPQICPHSSIFPPMIYDCMHDILCVVHYVSYIDIRSSQLPLDVK